MLSLNKDNKERKNSRDDEGVGEVGLNLMGKKGGRVGKSGRGAKHSP